MTPIERAALAVVADIKRQTEERWPADCDEQCGLVDGYLNFADIARAVLHVIREPSEAMSEAGSVASYDVQREERALEADEMSRVWQAMIDAALEEGSEAA